MLSQKRPNLQQSYKVQGIKKQCATRHAKKMDSATVHWFWLGAVKPITGDLCTFFQQSKFNLSLVKNLK
jgi:hypothetical protein